MRCPCCSEKLYVACCEPFHLAKAIPKTAEQLMRSRYSAYALRNVDYIVKTTLPAQQTKLDVAAITAWSEQTDWQGLRVLKHKPICGVPQAKVEFEAYYQEDGERKTHHEVSTFLKIQGRWYFKDPTV